MGDAGLVWRRKGREQDALYEQIGRFLADHRLSPDPLHYAFVHAVLSAPDSPLAREVRELVDGGVRLTHQEVERLGGRLVMGADPGRRPRDPAPVPNREADRLVTETVAQMDSFAMLMHAMHFETRDFGRDLAESAAAIELQSSTSTVDELSRLASAMISRVRDSEYKLAEATREAEMLRGKLAEARTTARRDPMTGLANRLAFAEAYDQRATLPAPHCIALCDVDRFKRINDVHGHLVGDRVLKVLGETLQESCAEHLVARHGGEEFVLLLNGLQLSAAAELLDSARRSVSGKRFRNRETGASLGAITFSAGVTAVRADEPVDVAIERADRLLYAAKAQGRDRICAG
ncbi:GGDEF domain-containing protein [Sphingomonas abaci]|uniref:diguanylate cyclase n=1 Tax=Sphingomonas abaci TaxID=237611 RepID=A0A7W7AIH4_9SPHN|nr:GGDEF domain-containing protein [Sphingomonas abaci]MBB4616844.1 diguanylate cyclase [Sphingomonas abaci]